MDRLRSAKRLGRSLWVTLIVAQAIGCVLIVSPIDHSSGRCELAGSTACATCLRTSCQTAIDACCNDKSCAGDQGKSAILDALDECGTGNPTTCAAGIGKGDSTTAASVRSCVTGTCKAACLGDAAVKIDWSCATARTNDNACSTCIYDKCATVLDECCSDASCSKSSGLADDLGACTGGDPPACYYRFSRLDDGSLAGSSALSGVEGKVRGCIASCGVACVGSQPRAHQECTLQSAGAYCECRDAAKLTGNECSKASVGGDCVQGNKGCTCGTYGCSSSSSRPGCSCEFHGGKSGPSCSIPVDNYGYGRCCIVVGSSGVSCSCSDLHKPGTCDSAKGEFNTSTCDYEAVSTKLDKLRVARCSF